MSVKWHGAEVLKKIEDVTAKKLFKAGLLEERIAKRAITTVGAVDTGRLRASITTATENSVSDINQFVAKKKAEQGDGVEKIPKKLTVIVGSNVEYAPFIELGTSTREARPYLRPALQQSKAKIEKLFGTTVSIN